MNLSGKTSIALSLTGLGTLNLKLDSETRFSPPWDLELGFSYRVAHNLVLTAGAQYTMWSALDDVEKTIKNVPVIGDIKKLEDMNFDDILILHAGLEYVLPGGIALRGGAGLDRYASPEKNLRPNSCKRS